MRGRLAALGLGALLGTGCFVDVSHVSDPEPAFRKARAEAESLAGRKGPARSVQVLVYDPSERELVRVSVPMWIARRIEKESNWDGGDWNDESAKRTVFDERGGALPRRANDEDGDRALRALRGRVSLEDLERSALGTLIEVEDEDGEQVMVWLR